VSIGVLTPIDSDGNDLDLAVVPVRAVPAAELAPAPVHDTTAAAVTATVIKKFFIIFYYFYYYNLFFIIFYYFYYYNLFFIIFFLFLLLFYYIYIVVARPSPYQRSAGDNFFRAVNWY
jgi:hypothetical protein